MELALHLFVIAILISGFGILSCAYMLVRNEYIYHYRMRILHDKKMTVEDCLKQFGKLPTYDVMMWQLYKWDWSEYLGDK